MWQEARFSFLNKRWKNLERLKRAAFQRRKQNMLLSVKERIKQKLGRKESDIAYLVALMQTRSIFVFSLVSSQLLFLKDDVFYRLQFLVMSGAVIQKIFVLLKIHNKQVVHKLNFQINIYFLQWYVYVNDKTLKPQSHILYIEYTVYTAFCF